jgi:hypothetical protein
MKKRYTLSDSGAEKLRRALMTKAIPARQTRQIGGAVSEKCFAKIVSHQSSGIYKAQEVFWNGSAWVVIANVSRNFGTDYGTSGLICLTAATDIAADTIVNAFTTIDTTAKKNVWVFNPGGSADSSYDGPFAVTNHATDVNKVTVGALRSSTRPDLCFIVPDAPLTKTAAEHVTVTANGYIYATVTREGVLALAAPAYASSLPACTATTIPWPLAYVTFADGAVTSIFQLQYGQIVTYKTISCTCS